MKTPRQEALKAQLLEGRKTALPAAQEGDALSREEKKARRVAELWSSVQARRGYFEVCNAYLEHARCCLKLEPAQILLLLHLMKFRSLTLKKRREAREEGNDASEFEAGHAIPGKAELARLMDFDPSHIASLARDLEEAGLLRRVPRKEEGSKRNRSNGWDVTPMLEVLDEHLRRPDHRRQKHVPGRRRRPCPCAHQRARKRYSEDQKVEVRLRVLRDSQDPVKVSRDLGIELKDVKTIVASTKRRKDAQLWLPSAAAAPAASL